MTRLTSTLGLALAALLCAGPAFAQDDPESALLEGDTGGGGLLERQPVEKPILADPDGAQREAVQAARAGLEKKINALQEKVQKLNEVEIELSKREAKKFTNLDTRAQKVTGKMLKTTDAFSERQNALLEAYRTAIADGKDDAKEKAAKQLEKVRKGFLKDAAKIEQQADKVFKVAEEMAAKALPKEEAPKADGE